MPMAQMPFPGGPRNPGGQFVMFPQQGMHPGQYGRGPFNNRQGQYPGGMQGKGPQKGQYNQQRGAPGQQQQQQRGAKAMPANQQQQARPPQAAAQAPASVPHIPPSSMNKEQLMQMLVN